jgi:large subunit ribosomal protein L31e
MAETKAKEQQLKENEKVFNIPLKEAYKKSERKRTRYSVTIVRNFLKKSMSAEEVKLGSKLNEKLWERSMKKPPRSVRVKAVKEGTTVKAELFGYEYQEFRAKEKTEKQGMREKLMSRMGAKAAAKEELEKKIEGKEEKAAEKKEEKSAEKTEEKKETREEKVKESK